MALVIKRKPGLLKLTPEQRNARLDGDALEAEILAFDISTKTGVVALSASGKIRYAQEWLGNEIAKQENTPRRRVHRALELGQRAYDLMNTVDPKLIVVEGYATHGKFINYVQYELGFAVRSAAHKVKIPFIEVSPTSLKKFVVGTAGSVKNKVGKDKVRLHVYKKWDFEHDSDNVIDAYGLARVGLCVIGDAVATKDQMELITKLKAQL